MNLNFREIILEENVDTMKWRSESKFSDYIPKALAEGI